MNEFLFRFPADTPEMTFETLAGRLRAARNLYQPVIGPAEPSAQIGTTITLRWHTRDRSSVMVRLYSTTIAILSEDGTIRFPNDDPHQATTEWISKILYDNGLGSRAWRIRRHAGDGPGPEVARGRAGLLCIDGDRDKPVHGRPWSLNPERIARNQDWREQWAASMAFRAQHPDEWAADLAAAKPHSGTPDYRDQVDPALWQGTLHQPSLTDIR